MSLIEKATSLVTGGPGDPVGTVHVVDPSPLNWLWVMYTSGRSSYGSARPDRSSPLR